MDLLSRMCRYWYISREFIFADGEILIISFRLIFAVTKYISITSIVFMLEKEDINYITEYIPVVFIVFMLVKEDINCNLHVGLTNPINITVVILNTNFRKLNYAILKLKLLL